jgi:DNA-binding transcriptional ArsR family regulator
MTMSSTLQVLADPRRRELVEILLAEGELPVGELVQRLPIAQSGVSRHLRILREGGLVDVRAEGQQRLYSLRPEPFEELSAWLGRYRRLWEDRLDNLDRALARRTAASASEPPPSGST